MCDYKRTPFLGIVYALVIGTAAIALVEEPGRPFGMVQTVFLFLLCYPPGLGLAMLSDPAPARRKADYLKIDFYAPRSDAPSRDSNGKPTGAAGQRRATQPGGTA